VWWWLLAAGWAVFFLGRKAVHAKSSWPAQILKYAQSIDTAAQRYNLNPKLLAAIIMVESGGNPSATRYEARLGISSYGLMQILPTTAEQMGWKGKAEELLDPNINIYLGAKYLRYQLDRYENDLERAVLAYNTGSARTDSNGQLIDPQNYRYRVQRMYESF
tara:strand:+ start:5076 stop:5561 length:486 start_codon:yes stop_codon:yes gene_type:complete